MPYSDQVDAEPVRQHVRSLLDTGMTVVQIQNLSGVDRTAIRVLLGDFPRRAASKQVRALTASRLLRTRVDHASAIEGLVPVIGTRRRIEALAALGWPRKELARRLGRQTEILQLARHDFVRSVHAQAVRDLYDELSDRPGPSTRVAESARRHGWLPPVWWDDDQMDDPAYRPDGTQTLTYGGRVLLDDVALPRAERVRLMSRCGLTAAEIAERLGSRPKYVLRDRKSLGVEQRPRPRWLSPAAVGEQGQKKLPPVEDIQFLLDNGESIAAIASRFGVSEDGVLAALRRSPAA